MKELWSIRTQQKTQMVFMIICIIAVIVVPIVASNNATKVITESKKNIYVLVNDDKLVSAVSTDLNNSYDLLTKGHIRDLNKLIFEQIPDPKNINKRLKRAERLGDRSILDLIDALKTNRFFNNIIDQDYYTILDVKSENISIDYSVNPHLFTCSSTLKIIRNQKEYLRKIVTQGKIEFTGFKTEDDHRGYLVKDFETREFSQL